MALSVLEGDIYVNGSLVAKTFTAPTSSVSNDAIQASAGISASKLQHQYEPVYSQDSTTDAVVERRVIHIVKGATGSIVSFAAGSVSIDAPPGCEPAARGATPAHTP